MKTYPYYFLDKIFSEWLEEDLGGGDPTTEALCNGQIIHASCHAKEALTICGLPFFARIFKLLDPSCEITPLVEEGTEVSKGTVVAKVSGPDSAVLTGERVALNILQHLSGIATMTKKFVRAVEGTGIKICDTRKTLPGWRWLQRYAVKIGGGHNHRYDLRGGILIKENHIKTAGGIETALKKAKEKTPHTLKLGIEITSPDDIPKALDAGAELILLDNMTPEEIKKSIKIINKRAIVEVSGGITLQNIQNYALSGIDIISIGALTHSVKAADLSLLFE